MKTLRFLITITSLLITATLLNSQVSNIPEAKLLWKSGQDFKVPESVCFDKANNVLYVANINGKPSNKDDNGFISKLSVEGKIIEKEWITGLHAPKGMGVYEDFLYVSDIDRVAKISIKEGKIVFFDDEAIF